MVKWLPVAVWQVRAGDVVQVDGKLLRVVRFMAEHGRARAQVTWLGSCACTLHGAMHIYTHHAVLQMQPMFMDAYQCSCLSASVQLLASKRPSLLRHCPPTGS